MAKYLSGCKKCRQIGVKVCSRGPKCVLEKRKMSPGQHGKKIGLKKSSMYGKQMQEKQKVKFVYGVLEKQFLCFFDKAVAQRGVTGDNLLRLLEQRLDNVVYRLKMASSRHQARQMVVHGHIQVNNVRVKSPAYLVQEGDIVGLQEKVLKQEEFLKNVIDKRLSTSIKVPEWLELQKKDRRGVVLRLPERADVTGAFEEHLIVELYSK